MQTVLEPTLEIVETTKSDFLHYRDRLMHLISFVPADKARWKPVENSRNAIQIVGHCALTNRCLAQLIADQLPDDQLEPASFFAALEVPAGTSIESVKALMDETSAELVSVLESMDAAAIESTSRSPFGPLPVTFWMRSTHRHLAGHVGQIEYLQTLWGDMDNHIS